LNLSQTVIVWSLPDGAVLGVLRGHEHVVECVAFCGAVHDAHAAKKAKIAAASVCNGCGVV
jgi:hypothetical protein